MMARRRSQEHFLRRWLGFTDLDQIVALFGFLFIVLAMAFGLANPLFEATDEIRHFRYVRYLQVNRSLPPLNADTSKNLQAHHPPLYYTLVALTSAGIASPLGPDHEPIANPYWGFRYFEVSNDNKAQYLHTPAETFPGSAGYQTVWVGRIWSMLFGLGTVVLTWLLARLLFPKSPAVAFGAMAVVGYNPMFLHGAASLNNDVPAAFFGAGVLYGMAWVLKNGLTTRNAFVLALFLGLGTLTKANLLPLALPVGMVLLYAARQANTRAGWQAVGVAGIVLTLTTGLWMAYSALQTGSPLGTGEYTSAWVGQASPAQLFGEAIANLPYTYTTLWARFNYGQIPVENWLYLAYSILFAIGILAAVFYPVLQAQIPSLYAEPESPTTPLWPYLLAFGVAVLAWGYLMITVPATNNARLIFPVLPVVGLVVAMGLSRFVALQINILLPAALIVLATLALGVFLQPAYAYPTREQAPEATAVDARFGEVADLLYYRVVADSPLTPGESFTVELTWRPRRQTAEPWSVFVHLMDTDGILAAQRDTWPGLGNAPTPTWEISRPFTDAYRVFIPAGAYTPTTGSISVGLWNPATGERLLLADGRDALPLGELTLSALPGPVPNALDINFANILDLRGYSLSQRSLAPGDTLELTTYWWAERPMPEVYNLFAHLIGPDGEIWGRADSMLLPPTPDWPTRELRLEIRTITLAENAPPGEYRLVVGLWREDDPTQSRLPMLHPDGREMGDAFELAHLRVEASP